jgi:hypothetical protein
MSSHPIMPMFTDIRYNYGLHNEILSVSSFKYESVEYSEFGQIVDCFYKGAKTENTPSPNNKCFFNAICQCLSIESSNYVRLLNRLREQVYLMSIWTNEERNDLIKELDPNQPTMASFFSIIHTAMCMNICICVHNESYDDYCATFGDRSKLTIHIRLKNYHYESVVDYTYDVHTLNSTFNFFVGLDENTILLPDIEDLKVGSTTLGDVFNESGQWYNSVTQMVNDNLSATIPQIDRNFIEVAKRVNGYSTQQEVSLLSLYLGMKLEIRYLTYKDGQYSLEGGYTCSGSGNGSLNIIYDSSIDKWHLSKINDLPHCEQNYQVLEKIDSLESFIRNLTDSFGATSKWYGHRYFLIDVLNRLYLHKANDELINKHKFESLSILESKLRGMFSLLLVDNINLEKGVIFRPTLYKYWGINPDSLKLQKIYVLDKFGTIWGAVKSSMPVTTIEEDTYEKDFPVLSSAKKTTEFLYNTYNDDINDLTNPEYGTYDESVFGFYEVSTKLKLLKTEEIVSPDGKKIIISFPNHLGNKDYYDFQSIEDNAPYECEIRSVKNIIHDFTFAMFGSDLDKSFSSAGLYIQGDPDNNKTPDMIIKHSDDHYSVVEFTTRNTIMRSDMRNRGWEDKTLKYRDAIHTRRDQLKINIDYYIIVVGLNGVQTNLMRLPTSAMDELVYRYKQARIIAVRIEQNLKFDIKADQDMRAEISSIKKVIEGIKLSDKDGNIDDNRFLKPYSKEHYLKSISPLSQDDYLYLSSLDRDLSSKSMSKMESMKGVNDLNIKSYREKMRNNSLALMEERQNKYESTFSLHEDKYRTSMKAPVQLPLLLMKVSKLNGILELHAEVRSVVEGFRNFEKENAFATAWFQGMCGYMHYLANMDETKSELLINMEDPDSATSMEDEYKKLRNKFNRVSVTLDLEESIELARLGINGKKFRNDPEVKSYRNESKKPFSIFSETDDIQKFINEDCLKLFQPHNQTMDESVIDLINEALKIHNCSSQLRLLNSLDTYLKSQAYIYTKFISDLAVELSISVKQNCTSKEFVIKRLRDFQVYVLIKSTGSDGKVFFSLLFKKDQEICKMINTTFKTVSKLGEDFLYTEFVSTNQSKLVNWTRCEALMLSLYAFWREQYSVTPNINIPGESNETSGIDHIKMWANCLIVLLNDKHQTEEVITGTRFIHMEAFVEIPNWPQPHKMFEKLSVTPRSRLEVFYIKASIKLMRQYTESPIRLDNSGDFRKWVGIKNPFAMSGDLLSDLPNHDVMLNTMYLGYLKNKDENPEDNAAGQLISKILGYEEKLPVGDDKKYLGINDPPIGECKTHMYSISLIKRICDSFLVRLKDDTGVKDPKEYLSGLCLDYLSHEFLESFVTLKASSNFSAEFYDYKPRENKRSKPMTIDNDLPVSKDNRKNYGRSKVIEKIQNILSEKDKEERCKLVVDLLDESLKEVEKNSCLHICIFRKNQHGGLREIYVLNIYERIVQKCIEDLSRSILAVIPSETMTHPGNKFTIPNKHNITAKKEFGDSYFTVCTSDDASKWNQGHHVSKFITMLVRILPSYWHGFIVRALQLWFHKKIFLGDDLLRLFNSNDTLNTIDEKVKKVHEIFKGRETAPWMSPGRTYIETESGFMQGILHYTSSLFHALFLEDLSERHRKHLPQLARVIQPDGQSNVVIDCMESSDDSAMIVSFSTNKMDNKQTFAMLMMVDRIFQLKELYGDYLGIYKSIKSTTGTIFMMEFNSEFFFAGDTHRPTVRWVNAAINISEQETIIATQEEMSNTLKDILEGGGTFYHTFVTQVAQALLHYRMYGSSVSSLWQSYCRMLKESKDPALGFFLLDHPMAAGLMGFNYNLWMVCKNSTLSIKYSTMLQMEYENENSKRKMMPDIANLGVLSRTTSVGFGNKTKWKKMCDRMHLDDDTFTQIEQNPKVLFFHANTVGEMSQKIAIKMRSPGVLQSLSKSNTLGRRVASSVYFITRNVLFSMSCGIETDERRKTSIYRELLHSNTGIVKILSKGDSTNIGNMSISEELNDNSYDTDCRVDGLILSLSLLVGLNFEQARGLLLTKYNLEQFESNSIDWLASNTLFEKLSKSLGYSISFYLQKGIDGSFFLAKTYKCLNCSEQIAFLICDDALYVRKMNSLGLTDSQRKEIEKSYSSIRKLFPMESDYIEAESNFVLLNLRSARSGPNVRRKIRSNIQLTGTELNSTFSVYSVAKFMWFGEKDVPAHPKTLRIVWSKYKEQWVWLRDTIDDTLSASPFVSYIQLTNFLSRATSKGRTLHFVGTMGKAASGNINIMTLIRNNYSNGILFSGGFIDIQKKEKSEDYKYLLSNLTMLNQSPLRYEEKLMLMADLLVENKDLEYSTSSIGSKRNKLAIIQMFLRSDPDLKYSGNYNKEEAVNLVDQHLGEYNKVYSIDGFKNLIEAGKKVETELIASGSAWEDVENNFGDLAMMKLSASTRRAYEMYILCDRDLAKAYHDFNTRKPTTKVLRSLDLLKSEARDDPSRNWLTMVGHKIIKNSFDLQKKRDEAKYSRRDIMEKIRIGNLGLLGGYVQKQKYNKKEEKYYGRGIWRGYLHDIAVQIEVDSDKNFETYLHRVSVSSAVHLTDTIHSLKEWAREHKVGNAHYSQAILLRGLEVIGRMHNFRRIQFSEHEGCPIMLDKKLVIHQPFLSDSFMIDVTDHSIRLLQECTGERVPYTTVLTVRLSKRDVITNESQSVQNIKLIQGTQMDHWLKDWILWRDQKPTESIFSTINLGHFPNLIDPIELKKWTKELFESALGYQGIIQLSKLSRSARERLQDSTPKAVEKDDEIIDELESMDSLITRISAAFNRVDISLRDEELDQLYDLAKDLSEEQDEQMMEKEAANVSIFHRLFLSSIKRMVQFMGPDDLRRTIDIIKSNPRERQHLPINSLHYKRILQFMYDLPDSVFPVYRPGRGTSSSRRGRGRSGAF